MRRMTWFGYKYCHENLNLRKNVHETHSENEFSKGLSNLTSWNHIYGAKEYSFPVCTHMQTEAYKIEEKFSK